MCHKKFLHLLVLHFPPLIFKTSPGGGNTGLLQTVVSTALCYIPCRDTFADGDSGSGTVAAVGGALKTTASAALLIVPC